MNWKSSGQQLVYRTINPLITQLIRVGITPNMITFIGLVLNLAAAIIFIMGAEWSDRSNHAPIGYAGAMILFAGLFDMIDGRLARISKKESEYGALFDSVVDRYSEMIMFLGICYYLVSHDYFLTSIIAFVAMIGSIMVSYTRARAEGLGVNCSVGIMQRPERILIVGVSAVFCGVISNSVGREIVLNVSFLPFPIFETITIFSIPLTILAIWANVTALRRLFYAKNELENK